MNDIEKMLHLIFEQMGVVAITDADGYYIYVNRKWEKDTGIPKGKALGIHCNDLIPSSRAMIAMKSRLPMVGEMFLRTNSGVELPSVVTYTPIYEDPQKEIVAGCFISSTFSDFSQAQLFGERMESVISEFSLLREGHNKSGAKYSVRSILGVSPAIVNLKEQIYAAAATSATCLIEGETGTGKELVAHAIHNASLRNIFPFIKVNCSAIPESLMESEFFGYEEGSFTGSLKGGRAGKFEKAHLGSIFLDEINSMSMPMQPKLLRVLQEKEIERIGAVESLPIDVRVISASNLPMKALVDRGKFRDDLFYRLNIITLTIPPLRERKEDILPLVEHYIEKYNEEMHRSVKGISEEALNYLLQYDWPGNVRELQNVIERAMNANWGTSLEIKHFKNVDEEGEIFSERAYFQAAVRQDLRARGTGDVISLSQEKENSEREAILNALKVTGNNKAKTARMLNISRTMLYKKLEKYSIL